MDWKEVLIELNYIWRNILEFMMNVGPHSVYYIKFVIIFANQWRRKEKSKNAQIWIKKKLAPEAFSSHWPRICHKITKNFNQILTRNFKIGIFLSLFQTSFCIFRASFVYKFFSCYKNKTVPWLILDRLKNEESKNANFYWN